MQAYTALESDKIAHIFNCSLSQCPLWNPTSVNLLIFGVAKSFWVNHFPLAINGRAA